MNCPECGTKARYSERDDAYYCAKCVEWLESKCSDPTCEFCYNRPTKPYGESDEQIGFDQDPS